MTHCTNASCAIFVVCQNKTKPCPGNRESSSLGIQIKVRERITDLINALQQQGHLQ